MISFISLSRNIDTTKSRIEQNLLQVFGSNQDYNSLEVIVENGQVKDIFQGYNDGAGNAKNDILVFLHDDVKLLGISDCFDKPLQLLKKPMTGIIGVAGSRSLPKSATWWEADNTECLGMAAHPSSYGEFGIHWNTWPHRQAQFGRVAVVDGCCLMIHRRTFEKLGGFDAKNYSGYHFYDIDLSIRACLSGFINYVAPIPIVHQSRGAVNENWEANRQVFLKLHGKHLPFSVKN